MSWFRSKNSTRQRRSNIQSDVVSIELLEDRSLLSGVQLVGDINPGAASSQPRDLINHAGRMYFIADNANGTSLYSSDGTNGGNVELLPITGNHGQPHDLMTINGRLGWFRTNSVGQTTVWGMNAANSPIYMGSFDSSFAKQFGESAASIEIFDVEGETWFTAVTGADADSAQLTLFSFDRWNSGYTTLATVADLAAVAQWDADDFENRPPLIVHNEDLYFYKTQSSCPNCEISIG